MKLMLAALLTATAISVSAAAPAQAGTYSFGDENTIYPIVDVEVVGENNEALKLAYMTTTHNFFLPWSMSDDGYVLVPRDGASMYYPITQDEIAAWQEAGVMPDPLPEFEVPVMDRIMGYLAWPTLAIIVGALGLGSVLKRRKQKAAATAA